MTGSSLTGGSNQQLLALVTIVWAFWPRPPGPAVCPSWVRITVHERLEHLITVTVITKSRSVGSCVLQVLMPLIASASSSSIWHGNANASGCQWSPSSGQVYHSAEV